MDNLLGNHLILWADLIADDFDSYYARRRDRLLALIEDAMGKEVRRDDLESGAAPEYEIDSDSGELPTPPYGLQG